MKILNTIVAVTVLMVAAPLAFAGATNHKGCAQEVNNNHMFLEGPTVGRLASNHRLCHSCLRFGGVGFTVIGLAEVDCIVLGNPEATEEWNALCTSVGGIHRASTSCQAF